MLQCTMTYCWKVQVSTGIIKLYVILGKKQTNSLSIVLVLDNFIMTRLNFIKQNLLEIKIWKIIFDIKKNLSMS